MDGADVGVLEQVDHVGFGCLLESEECLALESETSSLRLSDLSHKSLEGELSHKEVSGLLESSDVSQGDCPRSEASGLSHSRH